jgi:hypothetical protein
MVGLYCIFLKAMSPGGRCYENSRHLLLLRQVAYLPKQSYDDHVQCIIPYCHSIVNEERNIQSQEFVSYLVLVKTG